MVLLTYSEKICNISLLLKIGCCGQDTVQIWCNLPFCMFVINIYYIKSICNPWTPFSILLQLFLKQSLLYFKIANQIYDGNIAQVIRNMEMVSNNLIS